VFKTVKRTESYRYPVNLEILEEDGSRSKASFTGRFKRLSGPEVTETTSMIFKQLLSDEATTRKVLTGWEAVVDPDGNPIDFSPEALEERFNDHGFARDVVLSWLESVGRAKTKN